MSRALNLNSVDSYTWTLTLSRNTDQMSDEQYNTVTTDGVSKHGTFFWKTIVDAHLHNMDIQRAFEY